MFGVIGPSLSATKRSAMPELALTDFESLRRAIDTGTPDDIAALTQRWDEPRRAAVAKALKASIKSRSLDTSGWGKSWVNGPLALHAVDKARAAAQLYFNPTLPKHRAALAKVVLKRSPGWIADYVAASVARRNPPDWELLEPMMEAGYIPDGANQKLLDYIRVTLSQQKNSAEFVQTRPYLCQRLAAIASVDCSSRVLAELHQAGLIPTEPLLTTVLEQLHDDHNRQRLADLMALHDRLAVQSQARHTHLYLSLMASPSTSVAGFAFKHSLRLPDLDHASFLQAARPLTRHSVKTLALDLLEAIEPMAASHPQLCKAIAEDSLLHPRREVVERARKALQIQEGPGHDSSSDPLSIPAPEQSAAPGPRPIVPIENPQELLDALAAALQKCHSADEVERILDGLSRLADQRSPDFDQRVAPIRHLLAAPRGLGGPRGLLSACPLAGVLRLMLAAWLDRVPVPEPRHTYLETREYFALRMEMRYRELTSDELATLERIQAARDGDPHDGLLAEPERPVYNFVRARLLELAHRLERGQAAPMLAAPTHEGGWLHPPELVRRLAQVQPEDHQADLVAALLRLSGAHRQQALALAQDAPGESGQALRWALGADEGPPAEPRWPSLWLAAKRARAPRDGVENVTWQIVDGSLEVLNAPPPPPLTLLDPAAGGYQPLPKSKIFLDDIGGPWTYHWRALHWPANLDGYFMMAASVLLDNLEKSSGAEPYQGLLEPLFDPSRPWDRNSDLVLWLACAGKSADFRRLAIDLLIAGISDGRARTESLKESLTAVLLQHPIKLGRLVEVLREVHRLGGQYREIAGQLVVAILNTPPARETHLVLELALDTLDTLDGPTRQHLSQLKSGKTAQWARRLLELPEHSSSATLAAPHRTSQPGQSAKSAYPT